MGKIPLAEQGGSDSSFCRPANVSGSGRVRRLLYNARLIEPAASIAVAEGQNYPPSLDPSKVELTDKIKKMPAFDPTGKLDGYLFANPSYWNANQVEWTEKWDRIKAGS